MNILVTGGASGVGRAITMKLAREKSNVVYFTFNSSAEKAEKLTAGFSNTHGIKCDFNQPDELNQLLEKIDSLNLDAIVHNAFSGDTSPEYFHKTDSGKFLSDFVSNIMPVIEITKVALKHFRKKKQGRIVTILTSHLVNVPPMGLSSYVAGKAYLEKLTKVWANENVKFNITSNSVSPSFMETGLNAKVDERVVSQLTTEHPLKKLLTVEEVADAVDFLLNSSGHINGMDLVMNAGVSFR